MAREIKFRAWDTKYKQMDNEVCEIHFGPQGQGWVITTESEGPCVKENPRYILMQFTGLFDKNGKEIWEGDVVRGSIWMMTGYDNHTGEETGGYEGILSEVKFDGGMFQILISPFGPDCWLCPSGEYNYDLEVVGNIYEHPDLLK